MVSLNKILKQNKQDKKNSGDLIMFTAVLWFLSLVSVFFIAKGIYEENGRFSFLKKKISAATIFLRYSSSQIWKNISTELSNDPHRLLVKYSLSVNQSKLGMFPNEQDDGYLLLSGLDSSLKKSNVRLIKIGNGQTLRQWNIDWLNVSRLAELKFSKSIDEERAVPCHPILLRNGDLIFNVQDILVKVESTKHDAITILGSQSHHSIEFGAESNCIVTPSINRGYFSNNPHLDRIVRDDSILTISFEGGQLENLSFSKILFDSGLDHLMFGFSGTRELASDLIHLNQITAAQSNGSFWLKGDLLLSARHLSTVFLYRPKEQKIIWHQTGPWKNQHSVHFVDQNKIALLDNNVYGYDKDAKTDENFVSNNDINRIFVVDFSSGTAVVGEPFKHILQQEGVRPKTITEGRVRVLQDGGCFIEETNFGRHIRLSSTNLMWVRLNQYNDQYVGYLGWGRYYTKDEAEEIVSALNKTK